MKKMPRQPSVIEVARQIRAAAANAGNVFFTAHAEGEMIADRLAASDVIQALRACRVTEVQPSGRYKTEGRTGTGDTIAVVVQIVELELDDRRLRVITVWRISPR